MIFVETNIGTKDGERSAVKGDTFLLDLSVESNVKVFFSFECVLLLTVSLAFTHSLTDISQFVRASFLFEHQRQFEGS